MGNYKIAETVFSVRTSSAYMLRRLAPYACDEAAELDATPDADEIAAMREEAEEPYSDGYLKWIGIHRRLCDHVLDKGFLLFHGSALALDGEVYLFAAPSGTGKSTHARLWRERFGDQVVMVNDDKPLLKIEEDGVMAYGTPWDGKHCLSTNVALPLKALCLLRRDSYNHIEPISADEALPDLLRQAYRPDRLVEILQLVTRLADAAPLYRLGCNMEPEAAEVAWRGMNHKRVNKEQ